jgi:hypothetical protein
MRHGNDSSKSLPRVFTMLLRLRQLADHFYLIEPTLKDLLTTEDVMILNEVIPHVQGLSHRAKRIEEFMDVRRTLAANAISNQKTKSGIIDLEDESDEDVPKKSVESTLEYDLGNKPHGGKHGMFRVQLSSKRMTNASKDLITTSLDM